MVLSTFGKIEKFKRVERSHDDGGDYYLIIITDRFENTNENVRNLIQEILKIIGDEFQLIQKLKTASDFFHIELKTRKKTGNDQKN